MFLGTESQSGLSSRISLNRLTGILPFDLPSDSRSSLSKILLHSSTANDVVDNDVNVKVLDKAQLKTLRSESCVCRAMFEENEKRRGKKGCWDRAKTGAVLEPSVMI